MAHQAPVLPFTDGKNSVKVGRIFCVVSNYAQHREEMGSHSNNETPCFFLKPADNLLVGNNEIPYPARTNELHHEVELALAIHKGETGVVPCGYATAMDLTRRDLQKQAKQRRQPWTAGKCFPCSAPCSRLVSASSYEPSNQRISLSVNGMVRQNANLDQMIWKIPELLAHLDALFTLMEGDLLLTGTPSGVGPLEPGDEVSASIEGLPTLTLQIAAAPSCSGKHG